MKGASRMCHTMTIATIFTILSIPSWVLAQTSGKPGDSTISNQKTNQSSTLQNQATDMTGGQQGLAGKYDVVPVRQGELVDEKGGHLDQIVKNKKGETLGTIEKLLKDTKTGKIEYAVIELEETKYQLPLQWSQFKQEGGHLILNASKNDLYPVTSSIYSKDRSPDVSHYIDDINKVRSQPKPKGGDPAAGGTDRPSSAGTMGESSVGGEGPSGTPALPPGGAPGHEGDRPSSKR